MTISTLEPLYQLSKSLKTSDQLMPVLFLGHGSPMNGIEQNEFSENWKKIGKELPNPKAIIVISAHWLTKGTWVTAMEHPNTIHDFGGFPKALYDVQYPAPGNPELAKETQKLITSVPVQEDHDWGLDHGTWTILRHMYPDAAIPVLQLSIDYSQPASFHYSLAQELFALRKKGVLIIGSGNIVHNLSRLAWDKMNVDNFGFDWALEMNQIIKDKIQQFDHKALIDYQNLNKAAMLAIPTPDHYYPLLYILGLLQKEDSLSFFNDKAVAGSLTMTSLIAG